MIHYQFILLWFHTLRNSRNATIKFVFAIQHTTFVFKLETFIFFRIYIFYYDLLSALLGFMGGIWNSIFIALLKRFLSGPYFTLFILMTVSLVQWRAVIGIFNCRYLVISKSSISRLTKNFGSLFGSLFLCFDYLKSTLIFFNLLVYFCFSTTPWRYWVRSRSKEIKRGYRTCLPLESKQYNCTKLFKTYTIKSAHFDIQYNFICLSETFLDSSTPDNFVDIQGYNIVRTNHPDSTKRGGVCICYKESLPAWVMIYLTLKKRCY